MTYAMIIKRLSIEIIKKLTIFGYLQEWQEKEKITLDSKHVNRIEKWRTGLYYKYQEVMTCNNTDVETEYTCLFGYL